MKVALVHELLTIPGGAENVARVFADMFPDAPIYTLLYDEAKLGSWFPKDRVITSSVQREAWSMNHHLYLNKFPKAVEKWDFSAFDLVISSSSAFAHGIITNGKPKHLSYIHAPARYLWDQTHNVVDRASKSLLGSFKRRYLERTFHNLRIWDSETSERADVLIAPSHEIKRRIELYWRRESHVIPPPVDDIWIEEANQSLMNGSREYFLVVSTLAAYKQIELAIEAANQLKVKLLIAGDGAHRRALEKLAGPTVEFLGFQNQDQLKQLYRNAKATIFPGHEDFGLVPLESLSCGTPVIAQRIGGALETLNDETAVFLDEPSAESLAKAMIGMEGKSFDSQKLKTAAKKNDRRTFESEIRSNIDRLTA